MMKRVLGLLFCVTIVAADCMAMTFSEPREMGGWYEHAAGGIVFQNESSNKGDIYTGHKRDKGTLSYKKGVACFGNANDAVYIHYDVDYDYGKRTENFHFGGQSRENTIPFDVMVWGKIYFFGKNQDTRFYLLGLYGSDIFGTHHIVVGRKKNGTFVKYFDTKEIAQAYCGAWSKSNKNRPYFDRCEVNGDTISFPYTIYGRTQGFSKNAVGEFCFKWDDKAQWFGVEQVVY